MIVMQLTFRSGLLTTSVATLVALSSTAAPVQQESAEDLANLRTAFEVARHTAKPTADGLRLHNPGLQLNVELDAAGFAVRPASGAWEWGLAVEAYGFEGQRITPPTRATLSTAGERTTLAWSASLEEWLVNSSSGLEHGYTLNARPAGAQPGADLVFDLNVLGGLEPAVMADARGVRFLDAGGASALTYTGLTVFDANGRVLDAAFDARGADLALRIDEAGAAYPLTIDPMIQQAYLKPAHIDGGDWFGYSLALDGDTAVIGAPQEGGSGTGANGDPTDNGAEQSGAAYVFVREGCTWTQQAYLKASNTGVADRFGESVDISGDLIVVGAPREDSNASGVNGDQDNNLRQWSGAAYVFFRFGQTWGQEAYLKASHPDKEDRFGDKVAISGNRIVVGAPYEDSSATGFNGDASDNGAEQAGAAYLFTRTGGLIGTWSQALYMKAPNTDAFDEFGISVDIDGDTIVVGAHREDGASAGVGGDLASNAIFGAGAAYVVQLKGEIWTQHYLKASVPAENDGFGVAVAVSGDTIVVGAPRDDSAAVGVDGDAANDGALHAGAAHVFTDAGSTWQYEAYLKASNTGPEANFGEAVAIDGDHIVVGAYGERGVTAGINNDQTDLSGLRVGAAYSFIRSNGAWSQRAYLKGPVADDLDHFGNAVAVSGDIVLTGAHYEDSGSGGINGDWSDNSASAAGAAFAFDLASDHGAWKYGPGTGANFASLATDTPPIVNTQMTLRLTEWNTEGVALLMISAKPANAPLLGGTLLVDPQFAYFGQNHVTLVPCFLGLDSYTAYAPPQIAGHTVYAQAAMYDPALPFEFAFTNGLGLSFCP